MTTKRCCRCGETKPLEHFRRNATRYDGRQTYCRRCQSAVCREWYLRRRFDPPAPAGERPVPTPPERWRCCGRINTPSSRCGCPAPWEVAEGHRQRVIADLRRVFARSPQWRAVHARTHETEEGE